MNREFDFIVIGSGPGGQKSAVCAAKAGKRVALIEQDRRLGGACVHYGTIPSKALREVAYRARRAQRTAVEMRDEFQNVNVADLLGEVDSIVSSYSETVKSQMERNGVELFHGRGSFVGQNEILVRRRSGESETITGEFIILATGSKPRHPDGIPVDHEHILDGDSILKLAYLPRSLIVLGGGVIACEYASVFASLGVEVTIVDAGPRPLAFLDTELTDEFLRELEAAGSRYLGGRKVSRCKFDGVSGVEVEVADGEMLFSEKVFVALGRTGCIEALDVAAVGLEATNRGSLEVKADGVTDLAHVYAVGDLAGPPALATSAMEQGRRAVNHALERPTGRFGSLIPTGIYAIPELASVGLTEQQAIENLGEVAIGHARFEELARSQISRIGRGLLKIVADVRTGQILGVHAVGEGSADLIHVAQMALIADARVDDLIENVFNFPTLTEAYRIAALDCANRIDSWKEKEEETLPR